jgi:hypothetical protein
MLITGGIVADSASGSAGGSTASRNRYGQYIRNRSVPVNPNSSRQVSARNRFTSIAERWSGTLTAAQRAAWDQYGSNVTWKNALGLDVHLTGFNHYLRSNTAILAAGGSEVDAGPTTYTLPGSDPTFAAAISEATQQISVTFDNTLDWANETGGYMLISMSLPRSGSRTYIGGPYRDADAIDGNSSTPPTSPATITVPFAVAAGQKVEVRARIIRADGRVSSPFLSIVTVAS